MKQRSEITRDDIPGMGRDYRISITKMVIDSLVDIWVGSVYLFLAESVLTHGRACSSVGILETHDC